MYELLASVQSAVRRFNDRMKQIAKNMGADSPIIEGVKAKIDLFFPGQYRFTDGVPQLMKPAQIFKNAEMNQALVDLDENVPTWGEVRKSFESQYENYVEQERFFGGEPVGIQQFIKTLYTLPESIVVASEQNITDALEILKVKGRRKTYAELATVQKIVGDAT